MNKSITTGSYAIFSIGNVSFCIHIDQIETIIAIDENQLLTSGNAKSWYLYKNQCIPLADINHTDKNQKSFLNKILVILNITEGKQLLYTGLIVDRFWKITELNLPNFSIIRKGQKTIKQSNSLIYNNQNVYVLNCNEFASILALEDHLIENGIFSPI